MPYKHFTSDERDMLQIFTLQKMKIEDIAKIMGKHPSSVYREIARNSYNKLYISRKADMEARKRRRKSRSLLVRQNKPIMKCVEELLKKDYSPEQIVGRIKLENRHPQWHISHETIYQHIYSETLKGNDLRSHLRQGHKKRKKRSLKKDRRGIIPDRNFIDSRPEVVNQKSRRGDWEGDTIEGAGKNGYVATWVDRCKKYLVAYKLSNKSATSLVEGALKAFERIPQKYKKTFTVDNGKEFAKHKDFEKLVGGKVFFAHPYQSWERGLNENTNGLLRQYLPKKRCFSDLTAKELARIVNKLNNRPRKSLGYRTPREAFFNLPLALQT